MTVGRRNSQIDSGFAHRTVSAIRARLALVSETTIPILSISGIRRYWAVPSASEIAVLTLSTPMRFSTSATSRTATQTSGPNSPSGETTAWTIATDTTDARLNWARLNASLTERWRRLKNSASAEPTSRAAMNAGGETRKSPATIGSSLIENECALRPMCRWMTLASAR